jgi:hypothetical protein
MLNNLFLFSDFTFSFEAYYVNICTGEPERWGGGRCHKSSDFYRTVL